MVYSEYLEDDVAITTRKGDQGMSSVDGHTPCRKDSKIMEALGSLDELISVLGWFSLTVKPEYRNMITSWQQILMRISHHLSGRVQLTDVTTLVSRIEDEIIALNPPPLRGFVIPGGDESSTRAHIARTVCRKAERRVLSAVGLSHVALPVLNRLSDALFALACVLYSECTGESAE